MNPLRSFDEKTGYRVNLKKFDIFKKKLIIPENAQVLKVEGGCHTVTNSDFSSARSNFWRKKPFGLFR